MRAETGNCRWKSTPQDKTEQLLNLLSNSEALHHLESITKDDSFLHPQVLRQEKGEVRGNSVASVCRSTKQIIANSFFCL